MSKNISNKELDEGIKKFLESFSKEEWLKKLEEEKHLYESNKVKNEKTRIFKNN